MTCHLCGRSFRSVPAHLAAHGWTKQQYCEVFGLERGQSLEGPQTRKLRGAAFTLNATVKVENPKGGSLDLLSGPVALTEGYTKEDFLARYVNCQRVKICEPIERFTDRVLTRFYLDYPQILKNPEPPFTRADEQALLAEAEYFNGVTNGDAP